MKPKHTLWDAYLLTASLHWRGTRNEEDAVANFSHVLLILGKDYEVAKVTRATMSTVAEQFKRKGLSNGTINRRLAALSKVVRTAYQAGMRVDEPPGFRLKEAPHRTRVVTELELSQVMSKLCPYHAQLVGFLYHTGLRVSEALNLCWKDVTVDYVKVDVNKADLPRRVPLTQAAAEILLRTGVEGEPADSSERVFGRTTQAAFNHAWNVARRKMGLESDTEFVPHALRHTCASRLAAAGVSPQVIQKWLGHRSIRTTMQYVHLNDDSLFEAAKRL